jgi:hypothetical protein
MPPSHFKSATTAEGLLTSDLSNYAGSGVAGPQQPIADALSDYLHSFQPLNTNYADSSA